MKKNLLKLSSVKASVRKLRLMALMIAGSMLAFDASANLPAVKNNDITVNPQGVIEDEMVFSVKYNNASEDELDIRLVDENGTKLYSDVFTGRNLYKTFKVEADYGTLNLIITNNTTGVEQKFVVSTKRSEKLIVTSAH